MTVGKKLKVNSNLEEMVVEVLVERIKITKKMIVMRSTQPKKKLKTLTMKR